MSSLIHTVAIGKVEEGTSASQIHLKRRALIRRTYLVYDDHSMLSNQIYSHRVHKYEFFPANLTDQGLELEALTLC